MYKWFAGFVVAVLVFASPMNVFAQGEATPPPTSVVQDVSQAPEVSNMQVRSYLPLTMWCLSQTVYTGVICEGCTEGSLVWKVWLRFPMDLRLDEALWKSGFTQINLLDDIGRYLDTEPYYYFNSVDNTWYLIYEVNPEWGILNLDNGSNNPGQYSAVHYDYHC